MRKYKDEAHPSSVTGDGYILQQALAYAIVCIDGLPDDRQELSNRRHMMRLLLHFCGHDPQEVWRFIENALSHVTGATPEAWRNWRSVNESMASEAEYKTLSS